MPQAPRLITKPTPPSRDLLDRGEILALALLFSLLIHSLLMVFARSVPFGSARDLERRAETLFHIRLRDDQSHVLRPLMTTGPEQLRQLEETLAERLERLERRAPEAEAPQAPKAGGLDPLLLSAPDSPRQEELSHQIGTARAGFGSGTGGDSLPGDPLADGAGGLPPVRPSRVRPDFEPSIEVPPVPVQAPAFAVPPPPAEMRLPSIATPAPVVRAEPTVALEVPDAPAPEVFGIREDIGDRIRAKGFQPIDEYLSITLDTYHAPGDSQGFFRLRFAPNRASTKLRVMRKDTAFVLDCSRSMARLTFRQAQDGLRDCVLSLREEDRFNVIGFKHDVDQFADGLVPATMANKGAALRYIDELSPSGRTNIYESLIPISQVGGGEDHPFIVFLTSDGRPTFGVTDSRRIINDMTTRIKPHSSIYAVGVGTRRNEYLLDMLARRNKGFTVFTDGRQETQTAILDAFSALQDPLLINVKVDFQDERIAGTVCPRRVPDLFRSGHIDLFGRYDDPEALTLRFTGRFQQEPHDAVIRLPFPQQDTGTAEIAATWARNRVYELVGVQVEQGDQPDLQQEIRRLVSAYGLHISYAE